MSGSARLPAFRSAPPFAMPGSNSNVAWRPRLPGRWPREAHRVV